MLDFSNNVSGLTEAIKELTEQTGKREKYVDSKFEEQDKKLRSQEKEVSQLKDTRKDRHERNKNLYNLLGILFGNTVVMGFLFWLLSSGAWSPF